MSSQARRKLGRVLALIRKETRQMIRDPATIAVGVVLPAVLILLFGFGLSLDVKDVPIAVVLEDSSPQALGLAAGFQLSPYFRPQIVHTQQAADALMAAGSIDGIVTVPMSFARRFAAGDARVQVIVRGSDANRARIIESYVQGAIRAWSARQSAEGAPVARGGPVSMESRMWFNSANDSHYFLVPGLIVLVMTLIGAFLTAMVVAREWERGTFEALFVTPVRSGEILLGKTVPYFGLGLLGLLLCIVSGKFLFHVPIVGSLAVLIAGSMLYVLVAVGVGLLISSYFKNQLVASQLTMLATFMPALMLSGFLFDLRSMPWAVRAITYVLPARYYVSLLQTTFLAGNIWRVILPDAAVLAFAAALLGYLSRAVTHKRLG
ncbi:MAG TPA: ABC transporter permease [Steroidobacteraceae bacterium]|jgi:ABC-2 type transport system permease protein|nr:ABC transporter permease [Steroidobacteraceae bacterium]